MKLKKLNNNVLSILGLLILFLALLPLPVSADSGSLTGILKDKYTGKPVSGTVVAYNTANDMNYICDVGADGVYKFELPTGKYTFTISANGYKKETVDKEITKYVNTLYENDADTANSTSDISMVSTEPGSIEVTVNDKFSNPIAGASVTVTGDMSKSGTTDGNGKCTIDRLVAGTYTVTAEMTTTDGTDFTGTIGAIVEPGKKTVPDIIKVGSRSDSNPSSKPDSNSNSNTGSNPSSNLGPSKLGPISDTSNPDSRPNEGYIQEVRDESTSNTKYALEIRPIDIVSQKTIFGATLELTDDSEKHIKSIITQDANGWFLVKNRNQEPTSGYLNGDYKGVITAPGYKPYSEIYYIYANWDTRGTPELTKMPLDTGFFGNIWNRVKSILGYGPKKEVITPPGGASGV